MMPVLFIGHGSPMNAIEDNEFTRKWKEIAGMFPKPKAILSISAHWETSGTSVTAMIKPRTIHDFYGFPEILFRQEYPAPGSPDLASEIIKMAGKGEIKTDENQWGLDHGTWSVLLQIYPEANIPVVQLSLDRNKTSRQHFDLAEKLQPLKESDVLILCSGNIVHNLGMIKWTRTGLADDAYHWATEFDEWIRNSVSTGNTENILNYHKMGKGAELAVPSVEHFLPLIYFTGLRNKNEDVMFFCEKIVGGSISMTGILTQN